MIEYDPHQWRSHLLDIRGSMVRQIFARVFTCVVWSLLVVALMRFGGLTFLAVPLTAHSLLGLALSLLLVVRTNSSYDRYWEGRKLWGGIVNQSRNLARLAVVHLADDAQLCSQVVRLTIAFAYSAMHSLRQRDSVAPMEPRLQEAGLSPGFTGHVPLDVSCRLTGLLRQARDRGLISDIVLADLDRNVQLLIDYLGGCERIHRTPLPFAYMVHLRRTIILYTFTLPFALYEGFGWATIPVTFLVAYLFFGIEEIGVTIEDPFEEEDNDLPLEQICQTIDRNLSALIGDDSEGVVK